METTLDQGTGTRAAGGTGHAQGSGCTEARLTMNWSGVGLCHGHACGGGSGDGDGGSGR